MTAFLGSYIPPDQLTKAAVSTAAAPETFENAIAAAELLAPGLQGEKACGGGGDNQLLLTHSPACPAEVKWLVASHVSARCMVVLAVWLRW